jgi:LysM repeat protein
MHALARRLCFTSLLASAGATSPALGAPAMTVYEVRTGDSLLSISRRYGVTVAATCRANARHQDKKLFPGDRLIIPASALASPERPRPRRQGTGELAEAPAIKPEPQPLRSSSPAQAPDAERAVATRAEARSTAGVAISKLLESRWLPYVQQPKEVGFVTLASHGRGFRGQTGLVGEVIPHTTRAAFERLLFNARTGEQTQIASRLVGLLIQVSNTFGGRTLHVVSGFRSSSHATQSRHAQGSACDFFLEGVPNLALFGYLSRLSHVGVGYYPNSTFVHLDVRPKHATWVDLAGPGEAPDYVDASQYFRSLFGANEE